MVKNDLHSCTFAFFSQVATKEMKKKKQKHRIKEIEKRSSEKEMDMMDAYTDKPVQEQVSSCFLAHDVISCTCNFLFFVLLYSTVWENLTCSNFQGKFKHGFELWGFMLNF